MESPSSPASVRACHDALTAGAAQHAAPCVSADLYWMDTNCSVELVRVFWQRQITKEYVLEFVDGNRFEDNRVGAAFDRCLAVFISHPSRTDDDRHLSCRSTFPQTGSRLEAIHAGQTEVHKNNVWFVGERLLHPNFAVVRLDYFATQMANDHCEQFATICIVFNHQNFIGHGRTADALVVPIFLCYLLKF